MNFSIDHLYSLISTPVKAEELFVKFPDTTRKQITKSLEQLISEGKIVKSKKNRYAHAEYFGCTAGTFLATDRSFSFVAPDIKTPGGDIFIPPKKDGWAWHGDHVLVRMSPKTPLGGTKQEGQVIKILSRNRNDITGTLIFHKKMYLLEPDNKKYPQVEIPKGKLLNAKPGDKIAVKVMFFGDKKFIPQGVVTKVLGISGTMEASISALLHSNGISEDFPTSVTQQAQNISQEINENEIERRFDLRNKLIFTIDGDSSKDFDDAVSLEPLENGRYMLGVHIADVSHYVTPNTPLGDEAYNRSTSVYYADRVIPMLPFELSNGICSLNPDVERLCFTVFMEMDASGRRYKYSFYKSVIRSKARMTYSNVNKILAGDKELCEKYDFLVDTLTTMNNLAQNMRKRRMERGALELDIPEAYIVCDEGGKPVDVNMRDRGDSEKLIEEFMLIANETVAEYMNKKNFPAVYRIHEKPDTEKLKIFANFARLFGYKVNPNKLDDPHILQDILDKAKHHEEQRVLPTMLLRSLARARYSEECIGHYGLAAKYYLHFTSPIRRFPDLVTHRMLAKAISGEKFLRTDEDFCQDSAHQSSTREQAADIASRDIEKLYMAEYMSQFIGDEFDATISSIQGFGMFVELPSTIEGLIRLDSIKGDYYEYNEQKLTLTGKRTGVRYAIGMKVKVKLINASNITGQIDFELINQ